MATVKLLNTLENLNNDDFRTFKWHLRQDSSLEGVSAIKESKLEGAARHDTVDLMVKCYKTDGALKVTEKVLQMMCRSDLVEELSKIGSGPEGQSHFSFN